MKKTSGFLSLDWADLFKGLLVAVGGAVITSVQNALTTGSLDFKTIGEVAAASGLSYLAKNFLTPSSVVTPAE